MSSFDNFHKTPVENLFVKKVIKVALYLTAAQWELYDPEEAPAQAVAQALNANIQEYVNRGESRDVTAFFTLSLMRHNSEYGVNDTEPRRVLERVLDEIYGACTNSRAHEIPS